jgi:hypothetical protein
MFPATTRSTIVIATLRAAVAYVRACDGEGSARDDGARGRRAVAPVDGHGTGRRRSGVDDRERRDDVSQRPALTR